MKKFKHRIISLLLSLTVTVSSVAVGGTLPVFAETANGGDVTSTGLDLDNSSPIVETTYTAGSGTIVWAPVLEEINGEYYATDGSILTLNNATINTTADNAIKLPEQVDVTVVVNGINSLSGASSGLSHYGCPTIQGSGTLNSSINSNGDVTINGSVTVSTAEFISAQNVIVNTTGTVTAGYIDATIAFTLTSGNVNACVYHNVLNNNWDLTVYGSATYKNKTIDSLAVESGATLAVPNGTTLDLSDIAAGDISVSGSILNNGTIIFPNGITPTTVNAMSISGTGSFIINEFQYILVNGVLLMVSGDVGTSGLNLYKNTPTVDILYSAGNGYAFWEPTVINGIVKSGTLTLNNATIQCVGGSGISLPYDVPVVINVFGESSVTGSYNGIIGFSQSIQIQGSGTLTASATNYILSDINSDAAITITGGVSIDAVKGIAGRIITVNTTGTVNTLAYFYDFNTNGFGLAAYGNVTYNNDKYCLSRLNVQNGAVLTIPENFIMDLYTMSPDNITVGGSIVNNGTINLPAGTTEAKLSAMNIAGTGELDPDKRLSRGIKRKQRTCDAYRCGKGLSDF